MMQLLGLGSVDTTPPTTSDASSDAAARDGFAMLLSNSILAKEERSTGLQQSGTVLDDTLSNNTLADDAIQNSDSPDNWLALIENIRTDDASMRHLTELAAQHGLDIEELKASLQDAFQQLDDWMQTSLIGTPRYGKELPEDFHLSTTAAKLGQLLKQGQELELDERLQSFLQSIGQLTHPEQQQVQAQLAELMLPEESSLATHRQDLSALSESEQQVVDDYRALMATYSADELREALAQLSSEDIAILRSLVNAEYEIQAADVDGFELTGSELSSLQEAIEQVSVSQREDDSLQLADQEAELTNLLADVEQLIAQFADELPLEKPLSDVLAQLQQKDLSEDERARVTAVQALITAAVGELNPGNQDMSIEDIEGLAVDSLNASTLSALLSEMRQLLNRQDVDVRSSLPLTNTAAAALLPPAAQALSQVAQQLRDLIQAVDGQELDSGDIEPGVKVEGDLLRRIAFESAAAASPALNDGRSTVMTTGTMAPILNSGMPVRDAGQAAVTQHLVQSAYETARQAQQAVDILGTGAPERLRERVAVMFNTRTQAAEMRLDPPDLGRLNIRLNLNQDQAAAVSFQVTTPQAREALEQALPRLRELLAEQGIQLADANVSEQQQGQTQQQQSEAGHGRDQGLAGMSQDVEGQDLAVVEVEAPKGLTMGRVDYFV